MIRATIFSISKKTMQILVGALIMLHLLPMMSDARASWQSPMNEIRVIDRDVIRLSDVFTHVDSRIDKAIGPAPQPGEDIVLNARTLMKLAMAYGVSWQPSTTADQVTLRRDGQLIDATAIKSALVNELSKRGVSGSFDVAFNTPPSAIALNKDARTDLSIIKLDYNPNTANFDAVVAPISMPNRQINLSGLVERMIDVPVARGTLEKGAMITANDLDVLPVREAQVKADTLASLDTLVGLSVRRTIPAGRVIKSSDVEVPLSIKRGEKITLIYRTGVLELSAQGRSMQEGRKGDRIRIVNTDSNKSLQGTVIGDHMVAID